MGRKGRKARVSRDADADADADGSEDERAAPAATVGKSLYEVRRPRNPIWDLGRSARRKVACWVGVGCSARIVCRREV
jgi:hypothetical protein